VLADAFDVGYRLEALEQQTRPEETLMGVLFEDAFLDGFGTWPLAYIPYGGPDFGEHAAVGRKVKGGDADAYTNAWIEAGTAPTPQRKRRERAVTAKARASFT
jgi:hypothetical protein